MKHLRGDISFCLSYGSVLLTEFVCNGNESKSAALDSARNYYSVNFSGGLIEIEESLYVHMYIHHNKN
jgi:hypothetical protein